MVSDQSDENHCYYNNQNQGSTTRSRPLILCVSTSHTRSLMREKKVVIAHRRNKRMRIKSIYNDLRERLTTTDNSSLFLKTKTNCQMTKLHFDRDSFYARMSLL